MFPTLSLTNHLHLPTYFIILSGTYILCLFWLNHRFKTFQKDRVEGLKITMALIVGGFIGGRLLYIFYVAPDFYIKNPLDIFMFWNGGFVFYGGFLGSILTVFFVLKLSYSSFKAWADMFAPVLALGYGLGRLACFFNGCCFGKICTLPWAIEGRHPTQIYAFLWEGVLLAFLLWKEKTWIKKRQYPPQGVLFFLWLGFHAIGRMVMEIFRDDFRGSIFVLSLSTWISLSFLLLSFFSLFFLLKSKK